MRGWCFYDVSRSLSIWVLWAADNEKAFTKKYCVVRFLEVIEL